MASAFSNLSSNGGLLLVLAVLVPFIGALVGLVLGGRYAQRVALFTVAVGVALVIAITYQALQSSSSLLYVLGAWLPPLGITFHADGLAVAMLLAVAVVVTGIAVYAMRDFATPPAVRETRSSLLFWLLLLAVWGALNLILVSSDLFTLYVALELLTFAGVPLVSLSGQAATLRAALRYLLYALFGSVLYLLGAVLLYGAYGTLDIPLLAAHATPQLVTWAAIALMSTGLLAKTALFPLHLWLPPAHAGAPAAASALLSGLVIKGSWFLVLRLWLDVFPHVVTLSAAQALATLGAAAILLGNLVALRQTRLKLLIAYSTVAQIGYLFLMFPLCIGLAHANLDYTAALHGGMLQAISHATAKAAMFMAAGLMYSSLGHDRIADLRGMGHTLPITVLAFALGGISLVGLPPSGGFYAKWLLLSAALSSGQWWWALLLLVGGLLTSIYVFVVVVQALQPAAIDWRPATVVPRYQQCAVLGLALCSFLLGLAAFLPAHLLQVGRTITGGA